MGSPKRRKYENQGSKPITNHQLHEASFAKRWAKNLEGQQD
jgi:hypothetical protein